MLAGRVVLCAVACALGLFPTGGWAQDSKVRMYNTVKQKLMRGEPVVGGTVYTNDPNIYSAMAESGFDFLWIEMQHSPLMYDEVAKMIQASERLGESVTDQKVLPVAVLQGQRRPTCSPFALRVVLLEIAAFERRTGP